MPLNGEWDFKPQKVWEVAEAGGDVFGEPGALLVSEDGTVYFHDAKNRKHHIFSKNGEYVGSFGEQGEGPGEVRNFWESELFLVDDNLVITDASKIHFFSRDGQYVKFKANNLFRRRPVHFLTQSQFIYSPIYKRQMPGGTGKIVLFNLNSGSDRVLVRFSLSDSGTISVGDTRVSYDIGGLTPMMTVACFGKKIYYGMNDRYRITVSDLDGKILNRFSLDCKQKSVSAEAKRKLFKSWGEKPEIVEKLIKSTPDKLTCFVTIENHQKLIYVYRAFFGPYQKSRTLDIFSPRGEYLYKAELNAEDGYWFYLTHLKNLLIQGDYLYAFLSDEEGETRLAKYRIDLPVLK
jgi:hypothetical protein